MPSTSAVRGIRTPSAAAVAGIAFSILFSASVILTELAVPPGSEGSGDWISDTTKRNAVLLGFQLLPFASIAFMWFIGVLRDRVGEQEDRFFATVFLGSGLLFVAMSFTAAAVAAALLTTTSDASAGGTSETVWPFAARRTTVNLANVYGMRMAAVFAISTTTIATRLRLVPGWLTALGYFTGGVLLIGIGFMSWLGLLFPAWVFVLSVHVLVTNVRSARSTPHLHAGDGDIHPGDGDASKPT